MRGRPTGQQQAARVIADVLLGQESQRQLAEKHGVSQSTVSNLAQTSPEYVNQINQEKRRDIGDLLSDYLKESIVTLRVQLEHCRDKEWLSQQPAGDVAILHGVINDKAVRLLAAMRPGPDSDGAAPSGE